MIYRIGAGLIVVFWATMWTLLIRSEMRPSDTLLRRVPVELVLKQAFQHRQASHLFIFRGTEQLGHVRIAPQVIEETGEHKLELFGNFQLEVPGAPLQRVAWEGAMGMDDTLHVQMARGSITTRAVSQDKLPTSRLNWTADLAKATGHFSYFADDVLMDEGDVKLTREGLQELLAQYGADPSWWNVVAAQQRQTQGEVTAQRSRFKIKGQEIDAYGITVRINGQTLLEATVSELGQVMEATTLVGWTLRAE